MNKNDLALTYFEIAEAESVYTVASVAAFYRYRSMWFWAHLPQMGELFEQERCEQEYQFSQMMRWVR